MKKPVIIISLVLLAGVAIWYFNRSKGNSLAGKKVRAVYIGPKRTYTGVTLSSGDIISGTLKSDGSLIYEMWGNGIIASKTTMVIPAKQLSNVTEINSLLPIPGQQNLSVLENEFTQPNNIFIYS